jgi:hypothetical protein
LARLTNKTDPTAMAGTLGNALEACLVVGGLALGLVLGARAVLALGGERASPEMSLSGPNPDEARSLGGDRTCLPPDPGNCLTEKVPTQERIP